MRFDLIDLRLFVDVVQNGSLSKGADAAGMALASASARVSGMEAVLGAQLLERGPRGVAPTAAGRALLAHARDIIAHVERMRGDLRAFSSGFKGEIKLFSNTAALVDVLPSALRIFLVDHPNVDVEVEERISSGIVLAIADGQGDFGIVAGSTDVGRLETEPLGVDRLTVVAARAHPLAARETADFADLLREPFVGLRAGALHDHLAAHAAKLGGRIAYRVRLNSFEAVVKLVEAGIGIAILPSATAAHYRSSKLATVPLADEWATRQLLVCARGFCKLSGHARLLVDELKRQSKPG